jgi:hypothetical protein
VGSVALASEALAQDPFSAPSWYFGKRGHRVKLLDRNGIRVVSNRLELSHQMGRRRFSQNKFVATRDLAFLSNLLVSHLLI